MVVLVINQHRILALKSKGQPPIAIDPYRPMTIHAAGKGMKSPARDIHLLGRASLVQGCELPIEFFGVMRLNTCLAALLKKRLKSLVPE